MSYGNVPPPACLSGRPDRAPTTKDRLKDDKKVDEVSFCPVNWIINYEFSVQQTGKRLSHKSPRF